jgi:hypothetical protein
MKVFNLQCQFGHSFEGWFQSGEDYNSQSSKGILICPICEDNIISRIPSAAHIQSTKSSSLDKSNDEHNKNINKEVKKKLLEVAQQILQDSENVGDQFANEARRIHRNEAKSRTIHGTATIDESKELKEEGIDVLTLPLAPIKKKKERLQ